MVMTIDTDLNSWERYQAKRYTGLVSDRYASYNDCKVKHEVEWGLSYDGYDKSLSSNGKGRNGSAVVGVTTVSGNCPAEIEKGSCNFDASGFGFKIEPEYKQCHDSNECNSGWECTCHGDNCSNGTCRLPCTEQYECPGSNSICLGVCYSTEEIMQFADFYRRSRQHQRDILEAMDF